MGARPTLRVLQVVALFSRDGKFGGPLTVARQQCESLSDLGYNLTLVAASDDDYGKTPDAAYRTSLCPVNLKLSKYDFKLWLSLPLLREIYRRRADFDIAHIHLGRDLVTQSVALLCRLLSIPYVAQTHGMIAPRTSASVRFFDQILTRRSLRGARQVFYLTEQEKCNLNDLKVDAKLCKLRNSVRTPTLTNSIPRSPHDVLFLSRLHERKRPQVFVEMASSLRARGVSASYSIVGPDEGQLVHVLQRINDLELSEQVTYEGSLPPIKTGERIARAAILVLPSINEPFPMVVLEALSRGTPVVMTSSCGIAAELGMRDAARVTGTSPDDLAVEVQLLLRDPIDRARVSARAMAAARDLYSDAAVTNKLTSVYKAALCEDRPKRRRLVR